MRTAPFGSHDVIRPQTAETSRLQGFDLKGGMADAKAPLELGGDLRQQDSAVHVIGADEMRGESAFRGARPPDVQIVNLDDTRSSPK